MISPVTEVDSIREYLKRNLPNFPKRKIERREEKQPEEHRMADGHIVDEYA